MVRQAEVYLLFNDSSSKKSFNLFISPDNIKDEVSMSDNVKTSAKNGKPIVNGNGQPNGQMIYQNGNTKSDVAVIDIAEDGECNSYSLL